MNKIPDRLEDCLNGGFKGLYGEVVVHDCYRLRQLKFQPDVVIDLGGNVGTFARFARQLFPNAKIVSVEPHPENCAVYKKFTQDDNIILIEKAIGLTEMWHQRGARNGSGEVYLSSGLGYPSESMRAAYVDDQMGVEVSSIPSIMPDEIIQTYVQPGQSFIIKIDIEGGENVIWGHKSSMDAIAQAQYIAMEVHWYALTGKQISQVRQETQNALNSLEETHVCELDNVHFWANKK